MFTFDEIEDFDDTARYWWTDELDDDDLDDWWLGKLTDELFGFIINSLNFILNRCVFWGGECVNWA